MVQLSSTSWEHTHAYAVIHIRLADIWCNTCSRISYQYYLGLHLAPEHCNNPCRRLGGRSLGETVREAGTKGDSEQSMGTGGAGACGGESRGRG